MNAIRAPRKFAVDADEKTFFCFERGSTSRLYPREITQAKELLLRFKS
jgi:hypothetical protein